MLRVARFGRALAVVGAAGLLFTGSAEAGHVKLLGQTLNLHVATAPGGGHIASKTFTDPAPFSDSVDADDVGSGFSRTAASSMNASSGVDTYHVDGKLTFNSHDTRVGRSSHIINSGFGVQVAFEVDEPYFLTIDRSLVVDFDKTNGAVFSENSYRFLNQSTGEDPYAGSAQFALTPGTYLLDLKATGQADAAQFDDVSLDYSYRFDLNFTPGSTPPNAIPLPPAVWSGLIGLGAVALNRLRRRAF
jgi:hypothetical protein